MRGSHRNQMLAMVVILSLIGASTDVAYFFVEE
jgi:hypothetical protein